MSICGARIHAAGAERCPRSIIVFTRILGYGLSKMKQPSVIAEVIGGIVLGPT